MFVDMQLGMRWAGRVSGVHEVLYSCLDLVISYLFEAQSANITTFFLV